VPADGIITKVIHINNLRAADVRRLLEPMVDQGKSVALGVLDTVRHYTKDHWSVKWPNDIYWDDRKAAGILIDTVLQGDKWLYAVTGVGMNLNQEKFPPELSRAVSLKQITSTRYEPVEMAHEMVPAIRNRISQLKGEPGKILEGYNQSLYKLQEPIALRYKKELIIATLLGVDAAGLLITSQGSFAWGDVEFIVNHEPKNKDH